MDKTADSGYRDIEGGRPVRGLSLPVKLILAVISGYGMWPAHELGNQIDEFPLFRFLPFNANIVVPGAVFGALVMAPLITTRSLLVLRVFVLCICSIVAYQLAVETAMDDPFGFAAFAVAGFVGAELVAMAVVVLAPIKLNWRIFVFAGVAGAAGGEIFGHLYDDMGGDLSAATAYAVWQTLVCLALNLGARNAANHQRQSASL